MLPPSRASRRAFVMYQRARCSDSVSASHTTWIGWRMRRSNAMVAYSPSNVTVPAREECGVVTWIRSPGLACRDTCRCIFRPPLASRAGTQCPFEGYGSSSLLPLRLLTDRPGIEIPFQGLERVGPHRLVLRDPLVEFRQSLRFQLVDPLLRMHFDTHEPRLAEDLEVTGHGGLREVPEPGGDIACLPAAGCKKVEDRAARRVRDRKEDVRRHDCHHPNFFSSSAKKALERRSKSASLSRTSSPPLSFSTDFSGGSLIPATAEFGHPGSLSTCSLPRLSRIELHRTRTSFSGLPSLPSMPESRCTNMESRRRTWSLKKRASNSWVGVLPTWLRYACRSASTLARHAAMYSFGDRKSTRLNSSHV